MIYDDLVIYSRKTDFIIKQIDLATRSQNDDWASTLNRHIISFKPQDKEVVTKLLQLSVDLNQREGVEAYGPIFSKLFQHDEIELLEMSRFLITRKQYQLALFLIRRVREINPQSMGGHIEYVTALKYMDQYQKAEDYCKKVIISNPGNPYIKIKLAEVLLDQQKYNEAAKQLTLAEKINPKSLEVLLNQARLWRAQKSPTKAINYYQKYLQLNPTNVPYNVELGNYYLELRRWKKAINLFEQKLEISPNYLSYVERYAWILAACPDANIRDGQKAMEYAKRASLMRKFNDDLEFSAAMTLAVAFAEVDDFDNALKVVNSNLKKLQTQIVKDYLNKFETLQKLFKSNKPYRL